jgi:hypothetical protein
MDVAVGPKEGQAICLAFSQSRRNTGQASAWLADAIAQQQESRRRWREHGCQWN